MQAWTPNEILGMSGILLIVLCALFLAIFGGVKEDRPRKKSSKAVQ